MSPPFYVIALSLLMHISTAYTQGRKSLDDNNGISNLKLGTHINVLKSKIKYYWIDENGVESYDYTGNDIKILFGKKVRKVNLMFKNGRLWNITVNFGVLSKTQKWEIIDVLQKLYDVPNMSSNPDTYRIYAAKWETGKVYFQLQEYDCSSSIFPCETEIFCKSKLF